MMNTVLDHFGEKVKTRKIDEGHFSFVAEVSGSPTFLLGFSSLAERSRLLARRE